MSRYVKELLQKELEQKLESVHDLMVVKFTGVGGTDNNQMRGALKERGISLFVVKNLLMKRAFEKLGTASAGILFTGPCAVAYGGESIVDVAKEITLWTDKLPGFEIKGAFVEGHVLDVEAAESLSKMPSPAQLKGEIVTLANSPGRNLAGAIAGPAQRIAGCIKTIIENAEREAA
jgi:large subunit ribosomal protein L10